jgi:ABC-2 type transport system permease protein
MTMNTATAAPLAAVSVPARSFKNDLRAIKIVWHRELIRFFSDKPRILGALIQPLLYLFVFGSGMSSMLPSSGGAGFRTFLFPGVMLMAVLFTCFFSAASIVWDREFGFMREMMVAPIRRSSIVLGKCLGGATVGTFQGIVVLATAGLVGVPYSPALLLTLLGYLLLISFTLTSIGVFLAARIRQMQAFMALIQILLMPLFFLSGALYPLRGLPGWLTVLTRLDPLTYAVDPMRRAVLSHAGQAAPGVTWGSWPLPVPLELGIIAAFGLLFVSLAIVQFNRSE